MPTRPLFRASREVLLAAAERTRQQIAQARHAAPLEKVLAQIEAELARRD